jgi:hypothetical protein
MRVNPTAVTAQFTVSKVTIPCSTAYADMASFYIRLAGCPTTNGLGGSSSFPYQAHRQFDQTPPPTNAYQNVQARSMTSNHDGGSNAKVNTIRWVTATLQCLATCGPRLAAGATVAATVTVSRSSSTPSAVWGPCASS